MKNIKCFIISLVIMVICASSTSAYARGMMIEYDGEVHMYNGDVYSLVVNNKLISPPMPPIIFNDRALVPVREIFEEVGARVNYINDTQTINVINDSTILTLRINDNTAYINGDKVSIPDGVVPKLISKVGGETKTMVPVRFISESMGLDVEFNSKDGTILIESHGYRLNGKTTRTDQQKLVVLDAGHGGEDPGATGFLDDEEFYEKDIALQITYKVKDILEKAGHPVSLTRTGDTLPSLTERPQQANEEDAAVFVSIHINAVDEAFTANGTEVYYAAENNGDSYGVTSEELAHNILDRMIYYMHSKNRGVKSAEHAVTRRCEMPAALVEVGFITNTEELGKMLTDEYQQQAAQGIAEGIMITLEDIVMPDQT